MGKHKKHKKHHSHPHEHGYKELSTAQPEMRVVVPLQSLVESATSPSQLIVSIPQAILHAPHHHHHRTHSHYPHTAHQLHTTPTAHSSPEHKHQKKHKKKHKRHSHESLSLSETHVPTTPQLKIAPIRLPVPKPDPPPPPPTDSSHSLSTHSHTPHSTHSHSSHSKHHKHKHKRSRDSFEEPQHGNTSAHGIEAMPTISAPKVKRPKIEALEFTEKLIEPEKRLVTPLQIQLPPEALHEGGHKHKKKKKKHKHSKPSGEDSSWEVVKELKQQTPTKTIPQPSPVKEPGHVTHSPKATPIKVAPPSVQSSPGKQMKLLRGLESTMREKAKPQSSLGDKSSKKHSVSVKKDKPVEVVVSTPPPPVAPPAPVKTKTPQVKLSENALKFFLKNLLHLIQKRDPEGVFGEPVTDDIAPNYSAIIKHPMDLATMATKVENNQYPSINEFKADFELMCNNAMMYNAPETAYYSLAKQLLTTGLQIVSKETSLRPDILHGRLASAIERGQSSSPLPPIATPFRLPPLTNVTLDPSSQFLCRLPLAVLKGAGPDNGGNIDVSNLGEIKDQSHLTKVVVGVESGGVGGVGSGGVGGVGSEPVMDVEEEKAEEILEQALDAAEAVKENLDISYPDSKFCFLNRNEEGKTMLNILDPDLSTVDYSKPIDLTDLSNKVRMGNNAATVLKTELPMMKATPVSYLMYGPFGSFAPAYDSAFASLSKTDSDLLLSTYGNEVGVSYAHSLQQFVKGAGSFVTEMADAVLNGLTNNRHSKFMEKVRQQQAGGRESKASGDKGTKKSLKETESKPESPSTGKSPEAAPTDGKISSPDSGGGTKKEKETSPPASSDSKSSETPTNASDPFPVTDDTNVSGAFPVTDDTHSVSRDSVTEDTSSMSPMDTDSRPPFSVSDMVTETSSSFPRDDESRSSFPDSRFESRASSPLSPMNSGSGIPSVQRMDSSSSSKENPDESEADVSSPEGSSRSSSASENIDQDEDSRDSHTSLDFNGEAEKEDTVDTRLQRTSNLLAELKEQQNIRLSLPPEESRSGHIVLPGPSQAELDTASRLRGELSSLTQQARPQDVVSVESLHKAMGISEKTESSDQITDT